VQRFEKLIYNYTASILQALDHYFPEDEQSVAAAFSVFTLAGYKDNAEQKIQTLADHYGTAKQRVLLPHEIAQLEVGSNVEVFWPAMERSYRGVIARRNPNNTFAVHYMDDQEEATKQGVSVDVYRANAQWDLHNEVEATSFVADGKALIHPGQLKTEWTTLQPLLQQLDQQAQASRNSPCARAIARNLLRDLPSATYPNTRTLLVTMLVIPASSAQSERDFSMQVRIQSRSDVVLLTTG
jgi:hypothetical protein